MGCLYGRCGVCGWVDVGIRGLCKGEEGVESIRGNICVGIGSMCKCEGKLFVRQEMV